MSYVDTTFTIGEEPRDVRFKMSIKMSLADWESFLADLKKVEGVRWSPTDKIIVTIGNLIRDAKKVWWEQLEVEK